LGLELQHFKCTSKKEVGEVRVRRLLALLGAVALLAMPLIQASPAQASTSGGHVIACKAHLPQWPTLTPTSGSCTGNTPVGSVSVDWGLDNLGNAYVVVDPGVFSASFTYSETCVAGEPPAVGTANGTAGVTGATALDGTTQTSAAWTAAFSWTRVGATALVFLGPASVTFGNGHTATSAVKLPVPSPPGVSGGSSGVAVAAFVPTTVPLPTCAAPGVLDAQVAAVGAVVA
jgi:hypothetical protein